MLDEQAKHATYIIRHALDHDVRTVEAAQEAEDEWVQTILSLAVNTKEFFEACTPGYYNNEGRLNERAAQNGAYGGGPIAFIKLIEEWRATGELPGLELTA
jgi:cyclohexanone monooxygenase